MNTPPEPSALPVIDPEVSPPEPRQDGLSKVIFVLWEDERRSREDRERVVLDEVIPALLGAGLAGLSVDLDDTNSRVPSPSPFPLFTEKAVGAVGCWLRDVSRHTELGRILEAAGFRIAAYHVDCSVYTDYGGNRHSPPRDWPDGQRSPGLSAVTMFEKPRRLSYAEWLRRWHEGMSPVSEEIQPRQRYVRNRVVAVLTPGAPAFAGIVEEVFESGRHITEPMLFYGATGPVQLVRNILRILRVVTSFLTLWRIRTVVMSEYLVKSLPGEAPAAPPDAG